MVVVVVVVVVVAVGRVRVAADRAVAVWSMVETSRMRIIIITMSSWWLSKKKL